MNIFGSIPALVTPMHADGSIAWDAYKALIEWHIQEGTHAIVVVGTTGESPTVTVEEHSQLIEVAVQVANQRIPIIAGAGGNSTAEAIALTVHAKKVGADATLQVVPYYNKPTQEGMFQHFKAIAQAVDLPVILYNVPGRTVADMSHDTIVRLAHIPNIIGLKDATGDIGRGTALLAALAERGLDFSVFSGDDATAPALMLLGARGNISVTANVAPKIMSQLCVAAMRGDAAQTRKLNDSVIALHKHLFAEPNPVPVKWALARMGKMPAGLRLPLVPLAASCEAQVESALKSASLV